MNEFKKNIKQITSAKKSNWEIKADERLRKPWLKKYSSQIARRILALIERDKELNQAKLAQVLGVKAQQISKIVKGKENMTLETIYKISQALNFELISFPSYKYSRPDNKTTSYTLSIDSNSRIIDKDTMNHIYRILEQNTESRKRTGASGHIQKESIPNPNEQILV